MTVQNEQEVERSSDTAPTEVVAVVASAGGIHALMRILGRLPADLEAAVVVLVHLHGGQRSLLAEVLGRSCALPVRQAADGDRLERGRVYVAPPDTHLTVLRDGSLRLAAGPPIRHVRPSADVLLASLATSYESRALAVVLSGTGSDGAAGVAAVKAAGGFVIAQDEASSEYFGMPSAAIASGAVDRVLGLEEIGEALVAHVRQSSP